MGMFRYSYIYNSKCYFFLIGKFMLIRLILILTLAGCATTDIGTDTSITWRQGLNAFMEGLTAPPPDYGPRIYVPTCYYCGYIRSDYDYRY